MSWSVAGQLTDCCLFGTTKNALPPGRQNISDRLGTDLGTKLALLTDPWVFGSARQAGAVAAEGEHGQGDECLR
jgi:hypothetical protein